MGYRLSLSLSLSLSLHQQQERGIHVDITSQAARYSGRHTAGGVDRRIADYIENHVEFLSKERTPGITMPLYTTEHPRLLQLTWERK